MILKDLDIILTSKNTPIALGMGLLQKDKVRWGHVAIVGRGCEYIYESSFSGVRKVKVDKFFKKKLHKHYKILRYKYVTPDSILDADVLLNNLLGVKYSIKRILLQVLDHIFHTNKFTALDSNKKHQICSSFVAWIYYKIFSVKFNKVSWESADPDDFEDNLIKNILLWRVVEEK